MTRSAHSYCLSKLLNTRGAVQDELPEHGLRADGFGFAPCGQYIPPAEATQEKGPTNSHRYTETQSKAITRYLAGKSVMKSSGTSSWRDTGMSGWLGHVM